MSHRISLKKLCILAFLAAVTLAPALSQAKTSALGGTGYFSGGTSCTRLVGGTCPIAAIHYQNDVLNGRDNAGNGQAIPNSVTAPDPSNDANWNRDRKLNFISFVESRLGGGPQNATGAAFIINDMLPVGQFAKNRNPGATMLQQWEADVMNPDVILNLENTDPNCFNGSCTHNSSFYDPQRNDDFYSAYNGGNRLVLVFRERGTSNILYAVEQPCGNPVGGLPRLSNVNWSLNPTTTVAPTVAPGQAITFNFNVTKSGSGSVDGVNLVEEWAPYGVDPNQHNPLGNLRPPQNYDFGPNFSQSNSAFVVPANAQRGWTYCARITAAPAAWNNGGRNYGTIACATVVIPDNYPPILAPKPPICFGTFRGGALDQDSPGTPVQVDIYDVTAGATIGTTYTDPVSRTYDWPPTGVFNNYDDGVAHNFIITAHNLDANGGQNQILQPDTKVTVTMPPCYKFTYIPTAGATLNPDTENPTSVTLNFTTGLSTGSPAQCVLGATASWTVTHIPAGGSSTTLSSGSSTATDPCLPNKTFSQTVPTSGFQAGDKYCIAGTITPGSGTIDNTGAIVDTPSSPGPAVSAGPSCATITNKPFVKTFGGGVLAGGDFSTAGNVCSGGGDIKAWFNNSAGIGNNGFGASADLSVLALTQINGFASNHLTNTNSATGRTFANKPATVTASSDRPNLGGSYATGTISCFPTIEVSAGVPDSSTIDLNKPLNGAYEVTGPAKIIGSGKIGVGNNVAYHVKGDLYIDTDVKFETNPGWKVTASGTLTIPSFTLVVDGNIYIDKGVKQLDGVYIARHVVSGDTTKGNIYTCYDNGGNASGTPASPQYSQCNNQLVVNGALLSDYVHFQRTLGSLRDESSGAPSGACSNLGSMGSTSRATCAAEVIDFSPEIYLSNPPIQTTSTGKNTYDSITSLPPVL